MNKFIATKVGEVLAFARLGLDTLEQGHKALQELIDEKTIDEAEDECEKIMHAVTAFAEDEHMATEVETSASETQEKVTKMRDMYIGGNWDEASEVLEWMGFYTGAALVHWYLLAGAAKTYGSATLETLSTDSIDFYSSLFTTDEKKLAEIGASQGEK